MMLHSIAMGFRLTDNIYHERFPVLNIRRILGTEPVLWISSISSPTRGYCSLYISEALATINAALSGVLICSPIYPPVSCAIYHHPGQYSSR